MFDISKNIFFYDFIKYEYYIYFKSVYFIIMIFYIKYT